MGQSKTPGVGSTEYRLLLSSFTEWLELMGYAPLSLPGLSGAIRHFLRYQEAQGKPSLKQLTADDASGFIQSLQDKTGERSGRPLSAGHINKHIQSLKLLSRYVRETGRSDTAFSLIRMAERRSPPVWLTASEIHRLYEATEDTLLGIRDRAMLAVYYGCGLRLNEGAGLQTADILRERKLLHVRKGKRYKERYVPIPEKGLEQLRLYLDYGRPRILQEIKTEALFIGVNRGTPIDKQSLYVRIKKLVQKAGITKKVGVHTLRHSIATHLLQSGMQLEKIQQFLGHEDMDSTQIYTHLARETTSSSSF